jgi:hypothetical protein
VLIEEDREVRMRARLVISVSGAVLAITLPSAGQAPAPMTGTSAISGAVRTAATGQAIPAAVVTIQGGSGIVLQRGNQRQLTDAQGRFVFRDLPAGRGFRVLVARNGFMDSEFGQSVAFGPAGRIDLTEGQWFNRADVLMWKAGAIAGRVVDDNGDPAVGVFVRVLAQQMIAGQMRLIAGAVTTTDDRGDYRISGLLPSRYLVAVPSPQATVPYDMPLDRETVDRSAAFERELLFTGLGAGSTRVDAALDLDSVNRLVIGNYLTPPPIANGRAQAYPITFHPSVVNAGGAVAIDLGPAEERGGVDIALRPVPAARVAGRVEGPLDQVAGLVLRLMPAGLEELGSGSEAATTSVYADGRFVFLSVPAGVYTIDTRTSITELRLQSPTSRMSLPGTPGDPFRNASSGDLTIGPPGTGYLTIGGAGRAGFWTRTAVTVGGSDVDNLIVPLNAGVMLRGRLLFEGTVRTVATSPAGGGRVGGSSTPVMIEERPPLPERMPTIYAEPAAADVSLGVVQSISPAVDGDSDTFSLTGLRAGEYVLRVRSGAGRYMVKSIQAGGRDVTHRPMAIATGRNLSDVVVTFTAEIPSIAGSVQGDPSAVARSAVMVFPVEKEQWAGYGLSPTRLRSQPTVASAYRFDALPAGDYFVVAVDVSQGTAWQDPRFLARAAGVATRVSIGWGEARVVDLKLTRIQ